MLRPHSTFGFSLALLFCLALLIPGAHAAGVPKITFEKYTLPNGLQVILHQDRKLPVVHVNLWYHVGSKNEKPGRTGFAHLFEHMMFQGSKHVDGEYLSLVERAGANLRTGGVNGTTSTDRTNYFETVPSESLEYILWLESDRMGYLLDVATEQKFENQRDVVKNEKRQGENQPYGRDFTLIFENLFPKGHPYSWSVIGSMEDLSAATLDDVKEFFRTYYAPNNASLVIAGDFEPATAKALVAKYFGPIPPGPSFERPKRWVPTLDGEKRLSVTDRVPLPRLYIAYTGPAYFDPDEPQTELAARILADGKNSRLYKSLVYDRQLASDVSVYNVPLEIAGLQVFMVTARPNQSFAEIEKVVNAEVAKFAAQGPSPAELERAKAQYEADFVGGLERIGGFGGKADLLNRYNTYLGSPDYFAVDYERYRKVNAPAVREAARRYHHTTKRLVLGYTPETAARPAAAEFDRTQPPAVGSAKPFTPPTAQVSTLANGLKVVVVERRDVPKVAVELTLNSGAASDSADKLGLASLSAEMLDEGARRRSALEIAAELERLGATLRTTAAMERTSISLQTLSRNLKPATVILAEVTLDPAFAPAELERQRQRRLDALAQERNNPAALAARLMPQLLLGNAHPYSHPPTGTPETVAALGVGDLKTFHRDHYRPNNATLVFVGDVGLEEATALARSLFGTWQSAPVAKPAVPTLTAAAKRVYLVDKKDAQQSQIAVGSLGPARTSEDFYAAEVANGVLGGAFGSRLNLNLREDKGYSYGSFSSVLYRAQGGLWTSSGGVQTAVTKESLVEFERELRGVAGAKPFTAAELADARANLTRGYAQRFESNAQVAGEIATLLSYGLPLERLGEYEAGIAAVAPEQVQAVAGKYIDPDRSVVLVIGDLEKIEPAVRALGLGELAIVDADGRPLARSAARSPASGEAAPTQ
ncbi:MAG: insulinase family protein [Aphanocapsa lilacina HA4352-LM1]|jgi:zinc protease|nr:insulinase family protein [Aphanocapsa lilacina HA4352-LM1]